jgi:mono/diheme cytochrome c family protein
VDGGQQYNPECVQCHVTGYRNENGFYSIKHGPSREMANVQCENCHGPAAEHVDLEQQIMAKAQRWLTPAQYQELVAKARKAVPPAKVPASTCIQCHQGDNDPNFNYAQKLPKIDHGEVPEKDRQETEELRKVTGVTGGATKN